MAKKLSNYSISTPLIILAMASLLSRNYAILPASGHDILSYLPYLLAILLGVIGVLFNRRQLTVAVMITCLVYPLIGKIMQAPSPTQNEMLIYTGLSLFTPLIFLLNQMVPENGVRTMRAFCFYVFILLLIAAAFTIEYIDTSLLLSYSERWFAPNRIEPLVISLNALAFCALVALASFIWFIYHPSVMNVGLFFSLISFLIPIIFFDQMVLASIFISAALITALVSGFRTTHDLAYKDELTGLMGRRRLFERLETLGKNYCVAMVDIDHFKKFNDTYGHDVGDEVLSMIATKLQGVSGGGEAYRYGGEEFTILFKRRNLNQALGHLNAICEEIARTPFTIRDANLRKQSDARSRRKKKEIMSDSKTIQITVSIGVSAREEGHENPEAVIKSADQALYRAKQAGRNRVMS